MQRIARLVGISLTVLAMVALLPSLAAAHEQREIAGGKYSVVVGFLDEPAYTGFKNGLDLRVSDLTQATPVAEETVPNGVEGLASTLQVEIIYGDQTMPLTLQPRFRTPGAYNAYVIPMAAGDYTFHIFGTINGDAIDETFTSSPEGFSSVQDAATIQFPSSSAHAGSVAGTMIGDTGGTGSSGMWGGLAAGLALGGAGVWMTNQRRRRGIASRRSTLNPTGLLQGAGD